MRRAESTVVVVSVGLAVASAVSVRRHLPWIPAPYLGALVLVPVAWWWTARRTAWRRWLKRSCGAAAVLTLAAMAPVPWMKASLEEPPGTAWRLDDRLVINGARVDPPGTWYWLTAGRPPIVAELVRGWLSAADARPTTMRDGRRAHRPSVVEPAAAAVGLRRAGWAISWGVTVEVSEPTVAGLPVRGVLSAVNGHEVTTSASWEAALASLGRRNTITMAGGDSYDVAGAGLPFGHVDVIDVPGRDLDVVVGGRLARTLPGSWFRDLALGRSHGLMVALVSYVHGAGEDLAAGRAIAGTGTIRADGSVGPIGGLRAKAGAARHVGADVLLYPSAQQALLTGFDPGAMHLCPVMSIDQAIEALATTLDACSRPTDGAADAPA